MPVFTETLNTFTEFVALNTEPYVETYPLPVQGEAAYFPVYNAGGDHLFRKGDNIKIVSVGYVLPENFTLFTDDTADSAPADNTPPQLGILFYNELDSKITYLYELTGNIINGKSSGVARSVINVPVEGEYFLNAFINPNNTARLLSQSLSDFSIRMWAFNLRISMLNLPESYHNTKQRVRLFVKVEHTIPLYTIPPE